MNKHIFISQSELEMSRNRQHRRLEAMMDSQVKYAPALSGGNAERGTSSLDSRDASKKPDTYSQRKKDKDDGSNVSLSGDTKSLWGKNNKDEHMPINTDNHADIFPDITLCRHLTYCPIPATKKCLFNYGYESCQVAKFYEKWGR